MHHRRLARLWLTTTLLLVGAILLWALRGHLLPAPGP